MLSQGIDIALFSFSQVLHPCVYFDVDAKNILDFFKIELMLDTFQQQFDLHHT
jgi:hypothetical protein